MEDVTLLFTLGANPLNNIFWGCWQGKTPPKTESISLNGLQKMYVVGDTCILWS